MTWTINKDGFVAVVTADDVHTALFWLAKKASGVTLSAVDLVPMPTSTRCVRILQKRI